VTELETVTQKILELLKGVKKTSDGWSTLCPAHNDTNNSLSLKEGKDRRVLLHCHAGCPPEEVVATLGLKMADLFTEGKSSGGLTLEQYSLAKGLPVDYLEGIGLSTFYYSGKPFTRIPYFDCDGNECAVRLRLALEGENRFRWKRGTKPALYGLWLLNRAHEADYVILVEGESDCHTLWFHDFPALGIPGAHSWKEEWAEFLEDIPIIYVAIEPDKGGEAVMGWLTQSSIRLRSRLVLIEEEE